MAARVPIIVCGASSKVASQVKSNMLPEYDVVYAGYDLAAAATEVPQILSGAAPPAASLHTQLGSNDFGLLPRAVVTGGGYSEDAFQTLFRACAEACGSEAALPVPFFRADNTITKRLVAEGKGPATSSPEYPRAIANRLKEQLKDAGVGPGAVEQPENRGKQFFF